MSSVDPKLHRRLDVRDCRFLVVAVRHTPRQFWYLRDENLILMTLIKSELVAMHWTFHPSLHFGMSSRICLT